MIVPTENIPRYPDSYWLKDIKIPSFNTLDETIKTEVVIVGGGITGISTAYFLSQQGKKVVLIDAGKLLAGTTGHTTAKITVQHSLIYDEIINHFGVEEAKLYYEANNEALQFIRNIVTKYDIDCNFETEDAYLFTNDDDYIEKLQLEQKAYEQIGLKHELVKELPLNIPVKAALKVPNQANFHPLKYLATLIEKCVENGVSFYENTTAMDIEYMKHPAVIVKNDYRIIAKHVIIASHYPFYDLKGLYPTRMYADRSYIIAMTSEEKYPGGMYISAENPVRSIRSTKKTNGEELWLVGGEGHKVGQGKPMFDHYNALFQYADLHFNPKQFLYRWSAQDLITLDHLPYIGPITKSEDNIYIATGFRKWGMTNGTIAGKIISDLIITDGENKYKHVFSPSRKVTKEAVKNFVKYNTDVAKHLIKGKMEYQTTKADIKKEEATIVRLRGIRAGVYRDETDKLHIVNTTCTHLGCEVNWNEAEKTWDCPCHGSRFSYTGEVVEGPAKENLEVLEE